VRDGLDLDLRAALDEARDAHQGHRREVPPEPLLPAPPHLTTATTLSSAWSNWATKSSV
jgi:hypothetical protein